MVSVALLLVVSVLAVVSLQTWYGSYQSILFSDLNSQSSVNDLNVGVKDLIENTLYVNGGESGITITRIEIDGVECSLGPGTYTNLAPIDVSDCLELSSSSSVKDVLLITESDVLVKQVFVPLSPSSLTESNPITTIESNNNFNLLSNGIIDCSLASVGDRATLNGKNYTAVSNQNLSDMVESNNVTFYEEACTSLVTDMNVADNLIGGGVFFNSNINPNISHWDTSSVTDMSGLFVLASNFNQPLNFDTSSVSNMSFMFAVAGSFNSSLNFDTSSVVDMAGMFRDASSFNQPLAFDTSNVTVMIIMFTGANAFNQPLNFNTSSVTNMGGMFSAATVFNQPLVFDTSSVQDMSRMFDGAISFNQSLVFDTSSVTNMSGMFDGAISFNQPLVFDTSSVQDMSRMFRDASSFNQPLVFDTSSVQDMSGMFYEATLFNQPLNFNTSLVFDMSEMFLGPNSFNSSLNFSDTSSVIDMNGMFAAATVFDQPLNFNTSSVTNMNTMFASAQSFDQDLSGWCVSLILSPPSGFDFNTPAWNKTNRQPDWGNCP